MRRSETSYPSVQALLLAGLLSILLPGVASAGQGLLDERIDIELKDADVGQTLRSFGAVLEAEEVLIDPAVSGEVTITLHSVRVETVLTALCESVGCVWSFEDGVLTIRPAPEGETPEPEVVEGGDAFGGAIDLVLKGADLREVLQAFGGIAGWRVEIAPGLEGEVTIEVHETPAREALDHICAVNHCAWELVEQEGGIVLKVEPE